MYVHRAVSPIKGGCVCPYWYEGCVFSVCRLSHVQDVSRGHQLLTVVLKFLSSCLKLKVNRQYAIQPHLNTLNTLLAVLNRVRTHMVPHLTCIGGLVKYVSPFSHDQL